MKPVREILTESTINVAVAAELCNGNEKAVQKALQRVQLARHDLREAEARLRTILNLEFTL